MSDYGMFEDAALRDLPVRDERRISAMNNAYSSVSRQFGPFLRNAATRDDFASRLAMIEHEIDGVLDQHRLSSNDQNRVMAAVLAETSPEEDNPAFMVPGQEESATGGDNNGRDEDVKLEHISRRHAAGLAPDPSMTPPKPPKMPSGPPAMPAAPKMPAGGGGGSMPPASPAPAPAPSMGPTSTPPAAGPTLGPPSGRPNPGKVPGHGMPGQSPMSQPQPGKFKQMIQKVPAIGHTMMNVMNAPAKNLFDSPNDFLKNKSVNDKIWDAAQTAGVEPRAFMTEHWDELLWLYENSHAMMEGGHSASTKESAKKGHDRRTADWFGGDDSYDPVQGLNEGDNVVTTIDTTDDYNPGNTIPAGTSGTVQAVDGDQISVSFDSSGEATVDVQALQKTGSTGWQWDPDAQSFKSRSSNTFQCGCGQRVAGVGQHLCSCGRTWNISSFMNGSKQSNGQPMFACREVKTDPKKVLANRRMAAGMPPDLLPPAKRNQSDKEEAEKVARDFEDPAPIDSLDHDKKSAVEGLAVLGAVTAAAGVWPIINDKDVQKNWQSLMGIVTDPSQVGALENPHFQQLIQELYEEIVRRGLHTPDPSQNSGMADPTQQGMGMGIAPQQMGGQVAQPTGDPSAGAGAGATGDPMAAALQQVKTPQNQVPSQSVMGAYREGYKLAMDGFVPFDDEPIEVVAGWTIGLNQRLCTTVTDAYGQSRDVPDPYAGKRDTLGDITVPHEDGHPVNDDSLVPANNVEDPTQSVRDDLARKKDQDNAKGRSDDDSALHAEDFKPKTGPSYQNRKVDVN